MLINEAKNLLIVYVLLFPLINSSFLNNNYNRPFDSDDIINMNNLLEQFKLLKTKEQNNYFNNYEQSLENNNNQFLLTPNPRFKQQHHHQQLTTNPFPFISLTTNTNINDYSLSSFLKEDKEQQRKQGIQNGHILYQSKRTLNTETPEYMQFYYDLIE
jgi:hypothetical protein